MLQFIKERFDPASHSVMIVLFVAGHVAYLRVHSPLDFGAAVVVGAMVLTTLFFLKLRCYDEIKDYQTDLTFNPTRPLPRGLVKHRDLYLMIAVLIFAEIFLTAILAVRALPFFLLVIAYSLLMYKEFFIGRIIRPHLTTYAMSHTVVTVGLSLSLLAIFAGQLTLNPSDLYFALSSWTLFNLFEFGRKTYGTTEERDGVATYSNIWGRLGAVLLSLSQAVLSSILLLLALGPGLPSYLAPFLWFLPILLLTLGAYYLLADSPKSARLFRAMSSGYIILIYLALNSLFFLKS
ncbi:MAG: hypothetical protein A2X86_15460 [Bdellovibrionales bacterium GWA2_49_15]|nr:MAG: hypothetical protein A2X86_15460 [Bdellovibrionales bacterium GWA2_49_15]